MLTNFIVDILVLVIIIITSVLSAKHGFVRTVIEVVGFIAVILFVNSVSMPIAETVYNGKIENAIIDSCEKSIENESDKTGEKIWNSIPKIIKDNSSSFGISQDEFIVSYNDNIKNGLEDATLRATTKIIKPVIIRILSYLISIILFVILNFVVRFLAKLINGIVKNTFVGKLNTALGYVLGTLKGLIFSLIFCLVLSFIVNLTPNGIWIFTPKSISNSYFIKFVLKIIPQTGVLSYLIKL